MPLELSVSEAALVASLDSQLDTAFLTGVEYPAATSIIPKLDGYDKPMLIQGVDQAPAYRPKIRNPFSGLMAAVMKAVQSWQAATFENSWINYDSTGFTSAAYYRDFMGRCNLRGLVANGTLPGTIFTLPVGYRPTRTHIFAVSSNQLFGEVRVQADGQVVATAGNSTWISLDGISFRAEQ